MVLRQKSMMVAGVVQAITVASLYLLCRTVAPSGFVLPLTILVWGMLSGVATILLLERMILSPLARLNSSLRAIGESRDPAGRVPVEGSGELGGLAAATNEMLDALHQSQKQLEEQLLRAQRLETAGRIAGQVAHDFNNLLGPLSAYPELIKMQMPPDHPAVQYCDDMLEAAERMAYINEEMMTLGRRGRVEQEPIDLNRVARQAVEEIETASTSLKVRLDLTPDLPAANGSAVQLVRVVSNLVANARDAMQGTGTVFLKTDKIVLEEPTGPHGRREAREYVRLSVSDTGCGIPQEIRDKIFEAFFTTKDRTKRRGCGLGLSIVQAIVEDHKGFLGLESEVGKGTTFRVCLPACEGAARDVRPKTGMVGGSERVLVVDDDRLQREVARELLETLGYRVEVAASGEEAVDRLKEYQADLLVLDMVLEEGSDGAETFKQVLKMKPHQRAIVVSGFSESDQVKEALALGAGVYLRKPVTLEKLAKAVREELDRKN